MKRLSKLMVVCFMAAVMMMTVGCQKKDIAPIIPEGCLPGLFSVSETQQVYFSRGNLQYQASTNTWRFAEHQYDYVGTQTADGNGYYGGNVSGSDNRNISSTYSGWIDLFGWGTGSNPTLSSQIYWDYGTLRTLTQAEWEYLLNERPNASSKFAIGNINGVGGLILLPDSWTLPSECSFTSGYATYDGYIDIDWTHNSYTLAQWAQMEAAGAVFLPAAGNRYGTNVYDVGLGVYYWSSTPVNKLSAYIMDLVSSGLSATNCNSRGFGYSVRPVQDN